MARPKGFITPREVRRRISASLAGENCYWFGKHLSEEHRQRISKSRRGQTAWLGKHHTREARRRISQNHSHSKPWLGKHLSSEHRAKLARLAVGRIVSAETRLKVSKASKEHWQNSEYRDKVVQNTLIGNAIRPNKPEKLLAIFLEETVPSEYRYVGDGQFVLGGRCPDFLNVNGKKKLIELFGTYWHDVFDVARRIEHFSQYGFSTLIIWEDELHDRDALAKKVKAFNRGK